MIFLPYQLSTPITDSITYPSSTIDALRFPIHIFFHSLSLGPSRGGRFVKILKGKKFMLHEVISNELGCDNLEQCPLYDGAMTLISSIVSDDLCQRVFKASKRFFYG